MSMSQEARKVICIRQLLNELLPESAVREMKMLGDNKTSLILTRDPESQNYTKNIDVIHYHVKELLENGELAIK